MKVPMPLTSARLATLFIVFAFCAWAEPVKPSAALEVARQLNQAFIELADEVSPAVVVIKVAQKPSQLDLDGEDNPLLDMLPPEFRRQLERQREKDRNKSDKSDNSPGLKEP